MLWSKPSLQRVYTVLYIRKKGFVNLVNVLATKTQRNYYVLLTRKLIDIMEVTKLPVCLYEEQLTARRETR